MNCRELFNWHAGLDHGNSFFLQEYWFQLQPRKQMIDNESHGLKARSHWDAFLKDLDLFISLCIAQAIVWATVRRRRNPRGWDKEC